MIDISIVFSLFIFYLLASSNYYMGYGIEATPNASDVIAEVIDKMSMGKIAKVSLHVLEARDYQNMPNFVKDQIGKDINITVSIDNLPYFEKNIVNILISFVGDEKQQMFTTRIKP